MGVEIECKFLVVNDDWRRHIESTQLITQAYIAFGDGTIVRSRVEGARGYLTIKGSRRGIMCPEFEYPIPIEDAYQLIDMRKGKVINKVRHEVRYHGHLWQIDEFISDHTGLTIAEIELESEDERFRVPPWIGEEVSLDPKYSNAVLSGAVDED